jgi:hypothetical protein
MAYSPVTGLRILEQLPTVHRQASLPSWVPDYNESCDFFDVTHWWPFHATNASSPLIELLDDYRLAIKGTRIDIIEKCSKTYTSKQLSDRLSTYREESFRRQDHERQYADELLVRDIFRDWSCLGPDYNAEDELHWTQCSDMG